MLKNFFLLVLFTFECTVLSRGNESFQNLDKESESCVRTCATDPYTFKDAFLKSCSRGCRLFGICEWISSNLTEAVITCKESCNESYVNDKDLFQACSAGCDIALPLAVKRQNEMSNLPVYIKAFPGSLTSNQNQENPLSEMFSQNGQNSFFGFNDMMNNMMASAMRSFEMMRSFNPDSAHHTRIFDIKDGNHEEIIIIEYADPIINTPHPTDKKVSLNTGSNWFKTTLRDYLETNLQTNVNEKSMNDVYIDKQQQQDEVFSSRWLSVKNRAQVWWDCMSRKAGLPELVLFFFWISVSVILAFTCSMQFRSTPKLSLNGDLAYITDNKGELPSYMEPYPSPKSAKKSPYFLASVKMTDEKIHLSENAFIN